MIHSLVRLLPLDQRYTQQLVEQFGNVTRAVVVATVLSAIIQGLLAGLGFYLAGFPSIFLLIVLATLMAMVPFIGPPIVWAPACLWLFFYDGRTTAAVLLAIFGVAVVSTVDNIVKPAVLHGRSNLHPLLALLSVLGGVQALGPIGIFVGPMVVAFLQTLLNLLHDELTAMQSGQPADAAKPAGQTLGTS
jgi:predicted PurR-regulated permease PerM